MFTTPTSLKVYARTSIMFQSCGGALVFHYFPGGTLSVRRVLFCFMLAALRFFGRTNEKEKDDRFPGTRARVKREKTRRKEEVPNLFECIEENLPLDSFKAAHKADPGCVVEVDEEKGGWFPLFAYIFSPQCQRRKGKDDSVLEYLLDISDMAALHPPLLAQPMLSVSVPFNIPLYFLKNGFDDAVLFKVIPLCVLVHGKLPESFLSDAIDHARSDEVCECILILQPEAVKYVDPEYGWPILHKLLWYPRETDYVLLKVLELFPDSGRMVVSERLPLFMALSRPGQFSENVLNTIFDAYPDAAQYSDPQGNTVLHCGLKNKSLTVQLSNNVCELNPAAIVTVDVYGNTPMELAVAMGDEIDRQLLASLMRAKARDRLAREESENSDGEEEAVVRVDGAGHAHLVRKRDWDVSRYGEDFFSNNAPYARTEIVREDGAGRETTLKKVCLET